MNIARHIDELLFEHDCVILPEFGGFVGDYIAAKINQESNVFMPPSKYVLFNRHLTNNDGLLINAIANKENISYELATKNLKDFISEIKVALSQKNRYEIGEVGVFYVDQNKKVCFKHSGKNYSLASFGLPQFVLQPQIENEEVEHKEKVAEPIVKETKVIELREALPQEKVIVRKRNYWWVAAALLPIAFYSTWIPLKTDLLTDSSKFQVSDLNPFTFQKAHREYSNHVVVQPEGSKMKKETLNLPQDQYSTFRLDENTTFVVKPLINIAPPEVETTYVDKKIISDNMTKEMKHNVSKGYYVIGGCFSKKSNAENMVEDYSKKGYNSEIVDVKNNLYRVSISRKDSREEAKELMDELEIKGVSSWVLKK